MVKKIFCVVTVILLLFTGCKPVPEEEYTNEIEVTQNTKDVAESENIQHIKASIPYIQSEIPIDASVTRFSKDELYSYKIEEDFFPKLSALYEIFPELKNEKINAKTDSEERIIPPLNYGNSEMHATIRNGLANITLREQFASEEKIDNEYDENDDMKFNLSYEETESLVLNTAKTLFDEADYVFKIENVRRFGKYTGDNYYYFFILIEYDGVTFSTYGKETEVGKDDEGYTKYNTLRGGNYLTIYIDEQGISEMSWHIQKVARYHQTELLSFEYLFSKLSSQVTLYSKNNFAEFELNKDGTYKEVKPFTISKIEMIYALDYIQSEVCYVPCWKLTSFNSKGAERYVIINAVDGEILTARF